MNASSLFSVGKLAALLLFNRLLLIPEIFIVPLRSNENENRGQNVVANVIDSNRIPIILGAET